MAVRESFFDVLGQEVAEGDVVAAVTVSYSTPTLVIGPVVDITAARIKVRNKPHAGFVHDQTFQIDDSQNRVVKL